MAWYWWVLIIVGAIIFISTMTSKSRRIDRNKRRKEFLDDISTWKVGDKLKMSKYYMGLAKENGQKFPKLIKWDDKEIMIDVGDGFTHLLTHDNVVQNHDDYWRMKYASMDAFMSSIDKLVEYKPKNEKGEEVESKMEVKTKGGEIWIDDKPLMGMPEIYLKIYAGYAQEEENFKLLEQIRKELQKHR